MNNRLIIFTKYPEPGKVKTRLQGELGAEGAADLSRKMSEGTLATARIACLYSKISLEIRYAGGDEERMRSWLGDDLTFMSQGEGDLGQRMKRAFHESFEDGARNVAIIGTDCPDLDSKTIARAFDELGSHELVLGPAHDGGYYLIGLSCPLPELFDGIVWGTDTVFERTREIAQRSGCLLSLLPVLHDVDRPEDLKRPIVSVIIPTLNEEENIARAVESATVSGSTEIIVVDGGSTDRTVKIARDLGARVIEHDRGRPGQLNAGAGVARGEFLVFLHADSQLPRGYELEVVETLEQLDVACGAFALRFEGKALVLRFFEFTASIRSRFFKLPYGDQALFVTASTFHDLGGFPDLPLMDDFQFVRNAKKRGSVVTLNEQVITSSRRYEKKGPIRTTLLNQAIIIGYYLGISPKRLASWYKR